MTEKAPQEMESDIWAGEMGDRWNSYLDQFESMIAPAGASAIAAASFKPGESVIDVGSGGGITSFQISELVSNTGHVTGLDLSATLTQTANKRAVELGLKNIDFVQGDAGREELEGRQYDCLFSRFGVMFFADPYAAFKHMRGFIKSNGRLNIACWGPPSVNPWAFELIEVAKKYVDIPPSDPKAPGPFVFGDSAYLKDILSKAGFKDATFTSCDTEQYLGGAGATPELAARFLLDALFVGDLLKDETDQVKDSAYNDMVELLKSYQSDQGVVLQGNIWLVSARP